MISLLRLAQFAQRVVRSFPALALLCVVAPAFAAEPPAAFAPLAEDFDGRIAPLLKQYCLDCHATAEPQGELDLERFANLTAIRQDPGTWQKVAEMLDNGEMPPQDAEQLSSAERKRLRAWVGAYLDAEAHANAGDPGRVVLRRLSNTEYNYTLRDLTGIDLDPARDFPVDGAAGEGFTNTGESLVMSPALLTKYLDAGKRLAAHTVLLPDGFRFDLGDSRQDWSNELVDQIRGIYARFVDEEGRIPLERYLAVLLEQRERLVANPAGASEIVTQIAAAQQLNAKYLGILWQTFNGNEPSVVLDGLRTKFRGAAPADAPSLAAEIRAWQQTLFKFNNVGHFKPWQEAVNPIPDKATVRQAFDPNAAGDITLYLSALECGQRDANESVVWRRPRFEAAGRPPLLLRDVQRAAALAPQVVQEATAKTSAYLAAAAAIHRDPQANPLEDVAKRESLDADVLQQWLAYLGIQDAAPAKIGDYFAAQDRSIGGYAFVNGWSTPGLPSLMSNASEQTVNIPGTIAGGSVAVHPTPDRFVAAVWKSPFDGQVRIEAEVADSHVGCGNGVRWTLELHRNGALERLGSGLVDNGATATIAPVDRKRINAGDQVVLMIGARDNDHGCDLTHVELKLTELDPPQDPARVWSLAQDVSTDILAGNPHADRLGNADVWHFLHGLDAGPPVPGAQVTPDSVLAQWRDELLGAANPEKLATLGHAVQAALAGSETSERSDADKTLRAAANSLSGPLFGRVDWSKLLASKGASVDGTSLGYGVAPAKFGQGPEAAGLGDEDLLASAPQTIAVKLPADLVRGRDFVSEGTLAANASPETCAQLAVGLAPPNGLNPAAPIVTRGGTPARERLMANFEAFRQAFPAAFCYRQIVPVDEVITLVIYHREHDGLVRLMLSDQEVAQLDHLWSELRWVSQDAFKIQDAYGQLMEYATQDSDPALFEPLRKPINEAAVDLKQRQVNAEPRQLEELWRFAAKAYRRPFADGDRAELEALYQELRKQDLPHEEAFRLVLARVLVSPAFLYRVERPAAGEKASPINDWELAARLSYFLWASTPDDELLSVAAAGQLRDSQVLNDQAKRLMRDPRVRGLATEFACQWIDVQDFDSNDEKSEQHFPTFRELRGDMYEEAVRFFSDLFASDGSVLSVLDADHAFVNGRLAAHYGLAGVTGDDWRRVDGVKQQSRGGILAMAAPLAVQSGASRTSPILRGNWVVESLLGEKLPKPPKNVPLLPEDESATEGLTVRQLVEKHVSQAECSVCHKRIDPFGFALESFDPIGRFRDKDLGGRPIETNVTSPDGKDFAGLEGLRQYLLNERRDDFLHTFCKKLLGYALGRGVILSDEPLIAEMQQSLAEHDYKFSAALETIIQSPQFLEHRGRDVASPERDSAGGG